MFVRKLDTWFLWLKGHSEHVGGKQEKRITKKNIANCHFFIYII